MDIVERLREGSWQTIETAPKIHEKRILVVWLGHVQIAIWNAKVSKWQEDWYGDFTVDDDEVTHWMPLPQLPTLKEGE